MGIARGRVVSFLVLVLALSFSTVANAADHYVRAGATGTGTGADWVNAWSSYDALNWNAINPGETVYIAAGTYGPLPILKSGTAGNPITFLRATVSAHGVAAGWNAAYDGRVIIDGAGGLAAIGFGEGGDWMGHSFVTVDGATRYGIWCRNAMYGVRCDRGPTCDNVTLRNLELGDAGAFKLGEDGIQGSGNNLLVESCYIHDNDNISTHGDSVQWFGGNNFTFRYNVVKNCGQLFMITEIWGGTSNDYIDNLDISYNVFYNRSGTHYDGIKWKLAPRAGFTWKIYNNTFDLDAPLNPGDWEDRVMAGVASPNIDFRNNAVMNSRYGSIGDNSHSFNAYDNAGAGKVPDLPSPLNETGALGVADLGCVDAANADYHLLASSPLIHKGVNVGLSRDFDGNPVPATPSIGAFEFVSNVPPPPPPNHPPVANGQNVTVNKNSSAAIVLSATDADADALKFTVVTPPAHGTLNGTAPALTYTPAKKFSGADSFSFRANDGKADSNTATVTLTVVGHAPLLSSTPSATPNPATTGQAVTFSASATDADGDLLTYAWDFGDGSSGAAASATHAYTAAGTFQATVLVTDEDGMTATGSVPVVVTSSNDGGGGGGGTAAIDLGAVKLNSRVHLALPLPAGFAGAHLKFKPLTPLPSALHLSAGKLSGKARQAGVFTFDVQITKLERVKGTDGKVHAQSSAVTVTYNLTVN